MNGSGDTPAPPASRWILLHPGPPDDFSAGDVFTLGSRDPAVRGDGLLMFTDKEVVDAWVAVLAGHGVRLRAARLGVPVLLDLLSRLKTLGVTDVLLDPHPDRLGDDAFTPIDRAILDLSLPG